jgi:hypothetical protein
MFSELFPKISNNLASAIESGNELYKTRQKQIDDISFVEDKLESLVFNIPRTADRDRILRVAAKPRKI